MKNTEMLECTKNILLKETINKLLGIKKLINTILFNDLILFNKIFFKNVDISDETSFLGPIEEAFSGVSFAIFSTLRNCIVIDSRSMEKCGLVGSSVPRDHIGMKAIENKRDVVAIGKMLIGDLIACASPIVFNDEVVGFISVGEFIDSIFLSQKQIICDIDYFEAKQNAMLDQAVQKLLYDYRKKINNQNSIALNTHKAVEFVYKSKEMKEIFKTLDLVGPSAASVLIEGETGTGKELLARYIHFLSDRRNNNFIAINCSAIPDNLLESELFGYEPGSFTGATKTKLGKIELANGGTLFLDEIGDMTLSLQAKLLRFLEEKEIERLGSLKKENLDIRVIAATNRGLKKMIQENNFRSDLYYRLAVVTVSVPPIRNRKEDIIQLVHYYNDYFSTSKKYKKIHISDEALNVFLNGYFEGNVRELKNIMERLMILKGGATVNASDVSLLVQNNSSDNASGIKTVLKNHKEKTEEVLIRDALEIFSGNRTKTAAHLKISRRTLQKKILYYNIK